MAGVTTWEACLGQLAQRDGPVEITALPRDQSGEPSPVYKVRLLAVRQGGMVVDRPSQSEEDQFFQPGALVRLHVAHGPARWELMTHVLARAMFRLNDQVVVGALVLSTPHEARSVQRREFFRVLVAGVTMKPVRLSPIVPTLLLADGPAHDAPDRPMMETAALGPMPQLDDFQGHLLNIGGGGMGVEAPQHAGFILRQARRYRCQVDLPSDKTTLAVAATLVHLVPQKNGGYYMGLRFETDNEVASQQLENRICQFSTWLQRQQLQRLREKR